MNQVMAVIELVSQETGIPVADILGWRRDRVISRARLSAMRLAYEVCTGITVETIAKEFKKNHTCVTYAAGRLKLKQPHEDRVELVERLRDRARNIVAGLQPPKRDILKADFAGSAPEIMDLIFRQIQARGLKEHEVEDATDLPRGRLQRYKHQASVRWSKKHPRAELQHVDRIVRHLGYKLQAVPIEQGALTPQK